MKKVLFVASVMEHIKVFHIPYLNYFRGMGYEIYVATKDDEKIEICDKYIVIPFERSPLKKNNFIAYKKLRELFKTENFDVIHCHTPVAAFLTRIAARNVREKGTKVIYTAHGFHFFKGAPLLNWLIYFPVEWVSSFFTDVLITINKEDYAFAQKHLHAKEIKYIPGVGLDTEKIFNTSIDRTKKRKEIGISEDDFAVLSIGELNDNKNHETILKAISLTKDKSIKYVICGRGSKEEYLKNVAKQLGMEEKLILLGYRMDIAEICKACDLFAFPSKREGLPVSLMEAMAAGLPCVVSKIRGNSDLIEDGIAGYSCLPCDVEMFCKRIVELKNDIPLRMKMKDNNIETVKKFDIKNLKKEMEIIYGVE